MFCRTVTNSSDFIFINIFFSPSRDAERQAKDKLMCFLSTTAFQGDADESASPVADLPMAAAASQQYPPPMYSQTTNGMGRVPVSAAAATAKPMLANGSLSTNSVPSSSVDELSASQLSSPANSQNLPPLLNMASEMSRLDLGGSGNGTLSSPGGTASSVVQSPSGASYLPGAGLLGHHHHQHPQEEDSELQDLSLEIEREKLEYLEKSRHLQEQLKTLKIEIDELKVEGQSSRLDQFHQEQQEQGENKYSTIQKVKRGSMQSRVAFFEEL